LALEHAFPVKSTTARPHKAAEYLAVTKKFARRFVMRAPVKIGSRDR